MAMLLLNSVLSPAASLSLVVLPSPRSAHNAPSLPFLSTTEPCSHSACITKNKLSGKANPKNSLLVNNGIALLRCMQLQVAEHLDQNYFPRNSRVSICISSTAY
ncbi:uncharacterized protein RJT20DRAFT_12512 [Scheffersomyces xylosifermentans]|uniref:uncharacterized protein n=1 Tax=Scheffersomyces xylosifermentans TaxID=1304137 RepID=UPI00315DD7AB